MVVAEMEKVVDNMAAACGRAAELLAVAAAAGVVGDEQQGWQQPRPLP